MLRAASPMIAAVVAYLLLQSFGHEKALVGAVFALTVGLWMSEKLPIAVTALLSSALLICINKQAEKEVLAAYGDPIIPLFIGSFVLAKGMELTGLSDRFAYTILRKKWASGSPMALLFSLGIVSCLISLLVSNTATTAMMLPIGLAILGTVGAKTVESNYSTAILLMLTWGSSVAVGIPVGTPPNLIGIGMIEKATGTKVSFLQWVGFGMPITVVVMLACGAVLWVMYGRNAPNTSAARSEADSLMRDLGPMKPSERAVLWGFAVAMVLWILPDGLVIGLGKEHPIASWVQPRFPASVAALLGMAVMFMVPAGDRPGGRAISWREAATIDWGVILLFGSGIALGQALFATGLAKDLGEAAARVSGAHSVWAITGLAIFSAIVLSELASNTAAATVMVPVAIGLSQGAGVNPIPAALGAALGASFGFMLPVSTAPNAIVYSSGLVPSKDMLRAGILLDVVGFVVIWAGLRLTLPWMGLA